MELVTVQLPQTRQRGHRNCGGKAQQWQITEQLTAFNSKIC